LIVWALTQSCGDGHRSLVTPERILSEYNEDLIFFIWCMREQNRLDSKLVNVCTGDLEYNSWAGQFWRYKRLARVQPLLYLRRCCVAWCQWRRQKIITGLSWHMY